MAVSRTLRSALLCGVLGLVSFGCGSSEITPLGAYSGGNGPVSTSSGESIRVVTGRVMLGAPLANARISAYGLDGSLLDETTTGPLGCFALYRTLPPHFRVVARLGSQTFSAEVRNFDGKNRHVIVNVPTSLVSLTAGNALDLAPSEARVRKILQVAEGTSLDGGIEESGRGNFSHLQFFLEASRQGGAVAFAEQLLRDDLPHPFRLNRSTLRASTTGIAAELLPLLAQIKKKPGLGLTLLGKSVRPKAVVLSKNVVSQFSYWLFKGVLGDAFHAGSDTAYTWTAEQLGFNHGTSVELDEILNAVRDIQIELVEVAQALSSFQFQQSVDDLNKTTAALDLLSEKNLAAAVELGYSPVSGTIPDLNDIPRFSSYLDTYDQTSPTVSSNVDRFLSGVAAYTAANDLNILKASAVGAGSLVSESFDQVRSQLGLDKPARFANLPLRSNAILDNYRLYAKRIDTYQTLAANFVAENSHRGQGVATAARIAANTIAQTNLAQTQAVQQAPPYLVSDNILVDLENGVMWYLVAFDSVDYQTARAAAKSLQVNLDGVRYDHWRLPSIGECIALQQRGRFVAHAQGANFDTPINSDTGEGDTGWSLRGLTALGFTGLDAKKMDGTPVFDVKGNIWYDHWYTPGGDDGGAANPTSPWFREDYHEFRLNLQDDNDSLRPATDVRPYLVCRSIGTQAVVSIGKLGQTLTFRTVNPNPANPQEWIQEDIQQTEYPSLGVVTGLANVRPDTSATNNSLDVDLTYQVNVGGTFSARQGTVSANVNNPTFQYAKTFAQSRIVIDVIEHADVSCHPSFSSDNPNFELFNVPNNQGGYLLHNATPSNATVSANVTATYIGALQGGQFPAAISTVGTVALTRAPRALSSLTILPRNRLYTFASDLENQSDKYQVLAFYDDLSVEDVTLQANLNVVSATTNVSIDGASFSSANPAMQLNLKVSELSKSSTHQLKVTASFGGQSDNTNAQASY